MKYYEIYYKTYSCLLGSLIISFSSSSSSSCSRLILEIQVVSTLDLLLDIHSFIHRYTRDTGCIYTRSSPRYSFIHSFFHIYTRDTGCIYTRSSPRYSFIHSFIDILEIQVVSNPY